MTFFFWVEVFGPYPAMLRVPPGSTLETIWNARSQPLVSSMQGKCPALWAPHPESLQFLGTVPTLCLWPLKKVAAFPVPHAPAASGRMDLLTVL